ncbi:hypothetical protein M885DRAFT_749 [Pelagophyceae sp. CCMP2097]|nr:hypothetical protein M885DRAFT_749 [Pelagophyceae sp. CCMP2097]
MWRGPSIALFLDRGRGDRPNEAPDATLMPECEPPSCKTRKVPSKRFCSVGRFETALLRQVGGMVLPTHVFEHFENTFLKRRKRAPKGRKILTGFLSGAFWAVESALSAPAASRGGLAFLSDDAERVAAWSLNSLPNTALAECAPFRMALADGPRAFFLATAFSNGPFPTGLSSRNACGTGA